MDRCEVMIVKKIVTCLSILFFTTNSLLSMDERFCVSAPKSGIPILEKAQSTGGLVYRGIKTSDVRPVEKTEASSWHATSEPIWRRHATAPISISTTPERYEIDGYLDQRLFMSDDEFAQAREVALESQRKLRSSLPGIRSAQKELSHFDCCNLFFAAAFRVFEK